MKKLLFLTFITTLFLSCTDQDTTPPVITLNHAETEEYSLGSDFVDPGATATDNVDGVVPVTATNNIDKNKVGTYKITYRAEDNAGNIAVATRPIKYNAKALLGSYMMNGTLLTHAEESENYNQIKLTNLFGRDSDFETFKNVIISIDNNAFTIEHEYSYATIENGAPITISLISGGEILYENIAGEWRISSLSFLIREYNENTQQEKRHLVTVRFS
ncbi:DUF5011 domain-containing protein [Bacteroidales bacterium OttesenSCG-928-L19]|nr:DUF5011 domain-containing protein [Bacteroidales bacterium OttesenSCG-928-L19]